MSHRILQRLAVLVGTVAFMVTGVATAAAENYVAMGDSYSAGNGAGSTNLDATCYRNTYSYAYLLHLQRKNTLNFVACGGATTDNIVKTQAAKADSGTNLVTLTIGGNDVGFINLVLTCTTLGCPAQVLSSNWQIANQLPGKLDKAFNAIRGRAPNARVVVLGYPKPFSGKTCRAAPGVISPEQRLLNDVVTNLNNVIKARAAARGFTFVDPNAYWVGHDICSSDPFTNGFVPNITDAYHPTRNGYQFGYLPAVAAAL